MNAEISHVGRCMLNYKGKPCNKPATYVQIWSASRVFRYCEEHVPPLVKKTAQAGMKLRTDVPIVDEKLS